MWTASVSHSRDGYHLVIEVVPRWAVAADWLVWDVLFELEAKLGHPICSPPEWLWEVGIGQDKYPDPELRQPRRWSIGSGLHRISQAAGNLSWNRAREVYRIPLSFDDVLRYFPDARVDWDPELGTPDAARWSPALDDD